ncbi:unnamed protein product [Hyaloperonospora brassicae]|uniref:Fe2OG dioxygenase domain-containing protein n=1 Tax=Hyaloperonospora brassicae TaxID=162125 RepID=A0AAV0V411_HYABA|nr:unnamed protein product [Hyaloperonospora brassicae]
MDFGRLLREERRRARHETAGTKVSLIETKATDTPATVTASEQCAVSWQSAGLKVWRPRSSAAPLDLDALQRGPIRGVCYIPNWLTQDEEDAILDRVYAVPDDSASWVQLKHRRLQRWGGEVKSPFMSEPLPQWLQQISQTLVDVGVFHDAKKPNHALINEYAVGDYILPHEDGRAYFPLVCILSIGADCRVTFQPHQRDAAAATHEGDSTSAPQRTFTQHSAFPLERRSLLVFTGEAYSRYLHSIDNVEVGTRVSLTLRHVDLL